MTCPRCLAPLLADATFCVHCGLPLAALGEQPPDLSGQRVEAEKPRVPPAAPFPAPATATAAPVPPAVPPMLPIPAKDPLVPRLRRLGVIVVVLVAVGTVVAVLFGPLISAFTTTYPTPRISIQAGGDTAGLGMLVQFTASVAAGRDLTF